MTARADRNKTLAERLRDRIGCIDGWYNDASGELVSPLTEIAEDVAELESENTKLRELAMDFYDAIDSVFWDGEWKTKERFRPRMRELGIEVG